MNFLILFVIFLTLCEEMVNLQTLTKKTPLSIYEYSFDLQSSATKTIFFLYGLVSHTIVPKAVCPKCCTNLYQEREKVPSPENASTTPMEGPSGGRGGYYR